MKLLTDLLFLFNLALYCQQVLADAGSKGHHGRLGKSCKCFPDFPCWPSDREWSALNRTISGKLIRTIPSAAVCYAGPNYDKDACEYVNANWYRANFHLERPESIDSPTRANDSCLPTLDPDAGTCSIGYYPWYVINATTARDVSEGVKFAKKHGIRLVVKASGHDFQGRSTGFGSLSIWTRHIKGISFSDKFKLKGCKKSKTVKGTVASLAAGTVWLEAYGAANERNLTLSGGTVGSISAVGGHPQAAGHGFLSREFGLAADQPVEFEAVLSSGEIVTANECQNTDLFWALRGGGPGTYAVVTKSAVKTHPNYPILMNYLSINMTIPPTDTKKLHPNMLELGTYLYSQIPRLMDGGMSGYSYLFSNGQFLWGMAQPQTGNPNYKHPDELLAPILAKLYSPPWNTKFVGGGFTFGVPNHFALVVSNTDSEPNSVAGPSGSSASRLLPRKILENQKVFGKLLEKSFPEGEEGASTLAIGHHVADGKVRDTDADNAIHPAWRAANTHFLVTKFRSFATPEQLAKDTRDMVEKYGKALREVDPKGGAYMNEANYQEPDWEKSFFGSNWKRLNKIKEKYDPNDVFYCWHCVGSQKWRETDGRLCRK